MIQLAWRFLRFQGDSALAQWFQARTETVKGTRKPMIVALARKLLIALWRFTTTGMVPDGVVLRREHEPNHQDVDSNRLQGFRLGHLTARRSPSEAALPVAPYGLCAGKRVGTPPRSFAADAHDRIMVRISYPPDTRLWRDVLRPLASSPSDW